jgi:POT family proton-dependent oligopeptide transporter
MILGNLIIAFSLHFLFGNYTTIIGTGFFKPNISSMVGELYKVGTVVEMLVLDCFIPELILEHC